MAARAKELERELAAVEEELQAALAPLPNLPDPSAAPGPEDELVREVGELAELDFEPRDHLSWRADDRHGSRRARCRARASPTCTAIS